MDLQTLLTQFTVLAGFGGLLAVVINALKQFGVIKDGQAPAVSLIGNLIGFVAMVLLRVFAPDVDIPATDNTIGTVAQMLVLALGLIGQLGATKVANLAVRGAPVVGFSHSLERQKGVTSGQHPVEAAKATEQQLPPVR